LRRLACLLLPLALACSPGDSSTAKADGGPAAAEGESITTASGLQITFLRRGGGSMPSASSTVRVHYTGTFADGRIFDSSV